jgi:hypothetical protein
MCRNSADDDYPNNYISRAYMTVLGFGRSKKKAPKQEPRHYENINN